MATDCTRITIQNIRYMSQETLQNPTNSAENLCGFRKASGTLELFACNSITWWKSPAESPDLNPIEKVWDSMKNYLQEKHKPWNMGKLKKGIRTFWKQMTPKLCSRYIDHLQKVLHDVIRANGAPSGH